MDPMHRRLVNELKLRGYSASTVQCYLRAVQKLEAFAGRSIADLDAHDVRRYLLSLTTERKVSFSTYNQIACALRFFYGKVLRKTAVVERIPYQKQKRRLPIVLSRGEIKALVQAPASLKHRAVLMTLYA